MSIERAINTNRRNGLPGWTLQVKGRLFWVEKWTCILAMAIMVVTIFLTNLVRDLNLSWPNFGEWALVSIIP